MRHVRRLWPIVSSNPDSMPGARLDHEVDESPLVVVRDGRVGPQQWRPSRGVAVLRQRLERDVLPDGQPQLLLRVRQREPAVMDRRRVQALLC